ncbi:RNA polymerase sigma factor 54 interaction domain protein [Acididesulfobacillus acetoxydans]|uniref:Acetoin dehydrogenase operon transcriptional activator AcoR n=1 Tax=Acididesulfobacillus acetoxydans TaxID=1561005 RepID=A0A8S0Y2Q1_9FIRM|nr:sigma-54-dependent Fis family transcriptional regulator [Acididesulfobacillus acetoxydans]CAA7601085.1 RNA polymerase sigma factor 54 interaction domain protein [Acididesulfobacillus acetoxydans]CEJ06959.1 Acetoin dehydrogenase operon transcriptional activator AcoR [Acididesulfobacillus acetoxydans]
MKSAWVAFVHGEEPIGVEPVILRSWQRCLNHMIDYERIADNDILPARLLEERLHLEESLLHAARPVLSLLFNILKGCNHALLLSDRDGYIMDSRGDPFFLTKSRTVYLTPGVSWRETVKGTNAIGTALIEKTPVRVLGAEHFVQENHFLCSWAAPILGPDAGTIGILDISAHAALSQARFLELAILGARMIEVNLRLANYERRETTPICGSTPYFETAAVGSPPLLRPLPASDDSQLLTYPLWVGSGEASRRILQRAAKVAATSTSVLLLGESGTGKEIIARHIHLLSPRRDGPFVALNCSALPDSLVESELFGYAEGAFTGAKRGGKPGKFELARRGTIFLDEIGDISVKVQLALLRVLQDKEIYRIGSGKARPLDVRVIAATHRNLADLVHQGKFRLDLYYRLKVITIDLPPLRERLHDVFDLVPHFMAKFCPDGKIRQIAPEVYSAFLAYSWPGNVRELENCVESMCALANGPCLTVEDLPPEILCPTTDLGSQEIKAAQEVEPHTQSPLSSAGTPPAGLLRVQTRETILEALSRSGGRIAPAARLLGIGRNTLYRKLKELEIKLH